MKVLLFRHSYARGLSRHGSQDQELVLTNGQKIDVGVVLRAYCGKDAAHLVDNPQLVRDTEELGRDVVIVVLGRNSIISSVSNNQIKEKATEFYLILKESVNPDGLILAVQVEPQFVRAGNHHGAPEAEEFSQRRQIMNNYTKS